MIQQTHDTNVQCGDREELIAEGGLLGLVPKLVHGPVASGPSTQQSQRTQ